MKVDQLEWLKEHLKYEWRMLHHSYSGWGKVPTNSRDWPCFFECFAIHARNLYEFITSDPHSQNFKASDFIAGYAAKKINLTIGAFQKIDGQMFHMSRSALQVLWESSTRVTQENSCRG